MNANEFLERLLDVELIEAYSEVIRKLKERNIIRSKNVVGDLAEYLVIKYYNQTPGLPNLQAAPAGTQNVDALSRNGERYSIKATTSNTTSVFYGLRDPDDDEKEVRTFEHVIIALFDANYKLKRINELTWDQFLHYKRWRSRMRAWNLPITKELLDSTKTIYNERHGHN